MNPKINHSQVAKVTIKLISSPSPSIYLGGIGPLMKEEKVTHILAKNTL